MVGSNEKKINDDELSLYEDYWNGKWKCNLIDPEQWFNILVVVFLFLTQKNTIQFLLLLVVLLQLKSILMLPMHQVIYEGC